MEVGAMTMECPSCRKRLRVPPTAAGKKVKCPKCQTAIAVPAAVAPPAEPLPLPEDEPPLAHVVGSVESLGHLTRHGEPQPVIGLVRDAGHVLDLVALWVGNSALALLAGFVWHPIMKH